MCTEKSKDIKDKTACCDHAQFKGRFEMMSKCFTGKTGPSDCSGMMEQMKAAFCGSEKEETKSGCSG